MKPFKNICAYQIVKPMSFLDTAEELEKFESLLDECKFTPVGAEQWESIGWASPMHTLEGSEGLTVVSTLCDKRYILLTLKIEKRELSNKAINKILGEKIAEIEKIEVRKIGKKEKQILKEELISSLLPNAPSSYSYINGYIAVDDHLVVIEATSFNKSELFLSFLRKTIGSLPTAVLQGGQINSNIFTSWLENKEAPKGFNFGWSVKFVDPCESEQTVLLKNHYLIGEEVGVHILNEKQAVEIELEFRLDEDSYPIGFTVNEDLQIKKITWPKEFADNLSCSEDAAAVFDASFMLMVGTLSPVLNNLFDALEIVRRYDA